MFDKQGAAMRFQKYLRARASGYTPVQAIAYARGARLPQKQIHEYMTKLRCDTQSDNIVRAKTLMWGQNRICWLLAYRRVREAIRNIGMRTE